MAVLSISFKINLYKKFSQILLVYISTLFMAVSMSFNRDCKRNY